jgi:DeoR/GlpR family transcriptional regulator of sugar metabolism
VGLKELNTHQRRDLIAQKVLEQGRVQVSDLVEEFGMTDTSIRNDLTILEGLGLVRRVHGGAVSTNRSIQLAAYDTRLELQREQKVHIAAAAADRLHSADIALLDSGTTVQYLARQIPARGGRSGRLRIVTNSIPVLEEIGGWAPHNLLMLGGIFLPEHQATVGPETLRGLRQFSATCTFLGCDGLTLEGGITSAHPLVAEVGRAMAERADQVIVLADSSKLGQAGFVPIIPLSDIDLLLTDQGAPPRIVDGLRQHGVEVVLVD